MPIDLRLRLRVTAFTHIGSVLCLTSCLKLQPNEKSDERRCTACHGDTARSGGALDQSAPPRDLDGKVDKSRRGVGAHERHLFGKGHARTDCAVCHKVPESVFEKGHIDSDGPAEVVLSGLALKNEHEPSYDVKNRSCKNTYCHGTAELDWTAERSEKDVCGTCHGLPPALPHPQKKQCSDCHGAVISDDGSWRAPERHVDGKIDFELNDDCALCHGANTDTGAPPPDLKGNMTPKSVGVGAHETHLRGSETHRAVACSECHIVPEKIDSKGHIDDGRAEVIFGTLAKNLNHKPTYSTARGSCENSYCHGSISGNWQSPKNSVEACGSCHGLPPAAPHSQSAECVNCHNRVVDRDRRIIEPSLHVNGSIEVDFDENCSSCHGTGSSGAPPPDLLGNTSTLEKGVGAHAIHLNPGPSHGALACGECHVVPKRVEEPTHLDGDQRAEVVFGSLAKTSGYQPNYDPTTVTCTNTYCHREALPIWQAPRTSEFACGSCHELPPKGSHPKLTDCSLCHGMVIDKAGRFVAPELHVDGRIEVRQLLCNSCHGTDESGAPPPDFSGNMSSSARGVGAHERHSKASLVHGVVACVECHVVPSEWNDPMHLDGALPAEVTFGKLAQLKSFQPKYDVQSTNCTSTYCHGQSVPVWTAPRIESISCGTCHALPPPLPHPNVSNCSICHGEVIEATRKFVQPLLHVDGILQVTQVCNVCHGSQQNPAPPSDLNGNVDPSFISIGAHQIHLNGGASSREVECTACHIVPTTITSSGHLDLGTTDPAEIMFSGIALSPKAVPAWDRISATCSNTYCHGPESATNSSPKWNSVTGKLTCSSCHGMPPASPHTTDSQCNRCHSDVDEQNNITERALHINGEIDLR